MILRSGKYGRYFTRFAQKIVFDSHKEIKESVPERCQIQCTPFSHSRYATTIQTTQLNLDRSIKKLDKEARRTGRLTRKDVEDVLDEIRSQRSASTSQSLLILRCCGNLVPGELPEVRTALVHEIWKTLNTFNVPMNISHYNALLRVYLENEHPFSPTEFLADMESKDIEPNHVTYQRLISRYCQEGDMDGAMTILEIMHKKEIPMNESVFNALMMGHFEAGDIDSAMSILTIMQRSGVQQTAATYALLLRAYAKLGKLDEIISKLDESESKEIHLLDKDLLDVIYVLSTNGHNDKVDQIIPRLRKSADYNNDAVNVILRLVNKDQVDVAYEILKTMPRGNRSDGRASDVGIFFIKQMVKSKCPPEKILSICKKLQDESLNNRGLLVAVETAAISGNLNVAYPLFKELQKTMLPIRQHYFWPLIVAHGKIGPDGVLDILRSMKSEFNLTPNAETIRDYVIPTMNKWNYEKILLKLSVVGVNTSNGVSGCVLHALNQSRIKEAASLTSNYMIYYNPGLLRRPLINALIKTQDYESYISILHSIYDNVPQKLSIQSLNDREDYTDEEIDKNQHQSEILGELLVDAVEHLRNTCAEGIENIFSGLIQRGLFISIEHAGRIQNKLEHLWTIEISALLDKLTTIEVPVPYESRDSCINVHSEVDSLYERTKSRKAALSSFELNNGVNTRKVKEIPSSGNVEATITFMNDSKTKLNPTVEERFQILVKENQIEAATELIKTILNSNSFPALQIFSLYLNKIAENGNFVVLEEIGQLLTTDLKNDLSFGYILCHSYVSAGKSKEYIDDVIKKFNDAVTKEDLCELEKQIPKGAIAGIIEKHPDLLTKFEKCAIELADKGIYSPINIIWMNNVKLGKLELAEVIMKKYLFASPKIVFVHLTKLAIERKDDTIAKNLLKALKDAKVSEGSLSVVHSCLIDVYRSQGKLDEALKAIESAIKDVSLEKINRTVLVRVKTRLEKFGKTFPYKIPTKKKFFLGSSSRGGDGKK